MLPAALVPPRLLLLVLPLRALGCHLLSDGPVDGNIYVGNLRSAAATDYYTTRATATGALVLEPMFTVRGGEGRGARAHVHGEGRGEALEPRFTVRGGAGAGTGGAPLAFRVSPPSPPIAQFHGFRFVEITGLSAPPTFESVTGLFLRSALPIIGEGRGGAPPRPCLATRSAPPPSGNTAFPTSAKYLNSVQRATQWGIGSNLNGVISDCCQRDERKVGGVWGNGGGDEEGAASVAPLYPSPAAPPAACRAGWATRP